MKFRRISALILLPFCACRGLAAQQFTLRSETHLVTLTFTVHDARGNLIQNLTAGDFTLAEDGVPQKISFFSRESELPLTLGLLVDASSSQHRFLERHARDIELFLAGILRPQDRAFGLCFGDHLRRISDLTSSPAAILDGLESFEHGNRNFPELEPDDTREGGTALYDAVHAGVQQELAPGTGRRRALILFTDGEDNASAHDELEAIAAAQNADTLIYSLRYTEVHHGRLSAHNRFGMATLRNMSGQTGGRDFDALNTELPRAFAEIGGELRCLYSIGYYSTNKALDNTFRKVVVTPLPAGLSVRAKSGYYAR